MSGLDLLPKQGSDHLLAIDMPNFVHRAFHACAHAGKPEYAVATALRTFARFLRGRQPTHVLFAGEGVGVSFRRELSPAYKANRKHPDGLEACLSSVEVALQHAGQAIVRAIGHEADDALASVVRAARAAELAVVLATNDKDAEQLVDDERGIVVWDGGERVLDEAGVFARWGVEPWRLPELLALAGDSTDGVLGVPGWGKTRAAEVLCGGGGRRLDLLIQPGGEWFVPAKYRKKLIEHREAITLCLDLVRLRVVSIPPIEALRTDALGVAQILVDWVDE